VASLRLTQASNKGSVTSPVAPSGQHGTRSHCSSRSPTNVRHSSAYGNSGGWELVGGRPGTGLGLSLLALNAVALGVQSSAVLRLGISGLSTTYLTGTLTGVLVAVATRAPLREALRSIAILLGLLRGAAVGAALAVSAPRFAPIPLLVALAYVIAVASIRLRNAERPCNLIVSTAN
jgi:uncharacterized protein DUF1275